MITTTSNKLPFVLFQVKEGLYAIGAEYVREIVMLPKVVGIPNVPPEVRGVINLRGNVVPVLDLRLKFGMGNTEKSKSTCIIVVEFMLNSELFVVGILADSVLEVFEMEQKQIEPPPKFGVKLSTHYIRGIGRRADKMFIILVAERIFSEAELSQANEMGGETDLIAADMNKPADKTQSAGSMG